MVLSDCRATIGQVGNRSHELIISGKAGRTRWLGRRPKVRGVAMNPVDHPMEEEKENLSGVDIHQLLGESQQKDIKTRKKIKIKFLIIKRRS